MDCKRYVFLLPKILIFSECFLFSFLEASIFALTFVKKIEEIREIRNLKICNEVKKNLLKVIENVKLSVNKWIAEGDS